MKRLLLLAGVVLIAGLIAATAMRTPAGPGRLSIEPAHLLANGYDTATLVFETASRERPRIVVDNPHAATVQDLVPTDRGWQAKLRASILPGSYQVIAGQVRASLVIDPDDADSVGDGTPDNLRLDDPRDREAFRRWFTFLAEAQYFQDPGARPAEIDDCAALIRYAYREALRAHDSAWATAAHLPITPAFESVAKYQYPYTALGANLFRVPRGWAQFADAKTLERLNTYRVSRDLSRAMPGDLLFFRQDVDHMPFHSMVFVGGSHFTRDSKRYIVYHTGEPAREGSPYKRLTAEELIRYPEPDWRALESNPYFLGVYRWNILRNTP
jgi:uncharacterized protein YfaT (DUF1175 family)